MTLEEAIIHLQETLEDKNHEWSCEACKAEHEQLLTWLKELKIRRESDFWAEYPEGVRGH